MLKNLLKIVILIVSSTVAVSFATPTFSSADTFSVAENTTFVGTVTTTSTASYTISAGADKDLFAISTAGTLTFKTEPDYETPASSIGSNTYNIIITATDTNDNSTTTQTIIITVTDVIEVANFTIPTIADVNIAENTAYANSAIILAGDAPIGTVTYTLSGDDAADFSVNAATGVVSMVARDFENPVDEDTDNIYEITLIATDEDANSATQSLTVNVTDTPFAIQAITDKSIGENTAYSIAETIVLTGDTTIGTVSYSLSGVDAADFSVNSATGVVSMVARDFENPVDDDTNNVYEITLTAIADGKSATQSWTVSIADVIEVANFIIPTIDNISIAENTAYANSAITLTGDTPIGNVIYSLSGVDAADFSVNATTGVVSMVARDFENPDDDDTNNIYEITLIATDDDANSATQSLTVSIADVIEVATFTIPTIDDVNIAENTAYANSAIILAGDAPIGTVTYSLSAADAADFSVNAATGVVSMVARDFENPDDSDTNNTYEVTLIATDDDANAATQSWTVSVTDTPFAIQAITDKSIGENTAYSETIVLTGDTTIGAVSYSLSAADAADFSVNAAGVVSMVARDFENPDDFDTNNIYELTLTASADGKNATQSWTVSITDVIEVANFTIPTIDDVNIAENTAYANSAITLTGETPIGNVIYSLSGVDAADFSVNAATGVVSMVARDFENPKDDDTNNIYEITLIATDEDENTHSQSWTVTITNVTIIIPTIDDISIAENTAYANPAITLTGDTPIGNVIYSLSGVDAADFSVNATTGVVSMVARDFENPKDDDTNNIYEITLIATDDDANSATQSWTVAITDVTKVANFTIPTIDNISIAENIAYSNPAITLAGGTPIGNVTYTLSGIDVDDFSVDAANGVVSMIARDFENPEDADTNNTYEVTLIATDEDENTHSQSWTVTITNVTIIIPTIDNISIAENIAYSNPAITLTGENLIGTATYSLSGVDADDFSVNAANGVVSMIARNFENPKDADTNNTYEVTLTATDAENTYSQSWIVTITDVIEISNFGIAGVDDTSIAENVAYSQAVVLTRDAPIGNITYNLSYYDVDYFSVNANGIVSMTAKDFENPIDEDGDNIYNVYLSVADEDGNSNYKIFSITITDEDDIPTDITLSSSSIAENSATGIIGTLSTEDPDNGTHTYTLTNHYFEFDLEYELGSVPRTEDNFIIEDVNGGTHTIATIILNPNAPRYPASKLAAAINTMTGTTGVSASVVTDGYYYGTIRLNTWPDIYNGATLIGFNRVLNQIGIAIVPNRTLILDIDEQFFSISGDNLIADVVFDHEEKSSYSVNITTTDKDNNSYSEDFIITINDVIETATFTIATITNTIAENTTYSATITLTGDAPIGTVTYTLSGDDAAGFSVNAAGVISMVARDFENPVDTDMDNIYVVVLTAIDGDGNAATATQSWTVTITDENDAPTDITLLTNSIDENAGAGVVIGAFSTTDEDFFGTHTYALNNNTANFTLSANGTLTAAISFDYETQSSYIISVTTTDEGGKTFSKDFTITVNNDANEAPVISSANTFSVLENTTAVATLSATNGNGTVTFSASITGTNAAAFTLTADGVLAFNTAPVFSTTDAAANIYNITISAANTFDTTTQDISINIVTNPTFNITETDITLTENAANTIRHQVNITEIIDKDNISANANFAVSATGGIFTTNPAPVVSFSDSSIISTATLSSTEQTATLYFTIIPDATGTGTITITLTDENNDVTSKTLTVIVNQANKTPIISQDIATYIDAITDTISRKYDYKNDAAVFGGSLYFSVNNDTGANFADFVALQSSFNTDAHIAIIDSEQERLFFNTLSGGSFDTYLGVASGTETGFGIAGSVDSWYSVLGDFILFDSVPDDGNSGEQIAPGHYDFSFNGGNSGFFADNNAVACLRYQDDSRFNDRGCNDVGAGAIDDGFFELPSGLPKLNSYNFSIDQDSAATEVVKLTGFDLDSDNITWSYTNSTGNGIVAFTNNNTTNAGVSSTTVTYKPAAGSFGTTTLNIILTDDNNNSTTVTINVRVNSATPTAPTIDDAIFAISSTAANGYSVGTVTAYDVNGDTLAFTITSGNGAFAIGSSSGEITVADNTQLATQQLVVQVSDSSLTATATITINIIFAPSISLSVSTLTATADSAISDITVTNSGGDATYSISPAIDNGLSFDTTDGTISGIPANAATNVVYTVTASNIGGNSTATLNITVNPKAPNISLSATDITVTAGSAINNITVTNSGGDATYSISPALNNGLSFNTADGTISGTPSTPATQQLYVITATNITDTDVAILNITVNPAAPDISLSTTTVVASVATAITAITVSNDGGTATYSISPALSEGLSFATTDGTISGTPNTTATLQVYTITASNVTNSDSATLSITVNIEAPSISLSTTTITATAGSAISDITVTNSGGDATYSISPAIDNALSFDTTDGTISGTPANAATNVVYTITASNVSGNSTATVEITVNPAAPDISLSTTTITATAGRAISDITVINSGGTATSYAISPALNVGLSFSTETGTISGTPANAATNAQWTITASNVSGNSTATLNITVNPKAPNISLSTTTITAVVGIYVDISATNTGGVADLYSIAPAITNNLSFDTATGSISGTPSASATAMIYTITATNVTNSDSATLSITVNPAAITFSLDIDGNGTVNAPNDGLIIFKYLLNSNANNLHTTIASDAMEGRKTSAQLKAYLDDAGTILDVDGNKTINAPNDGLIIFKYLLNSNANNLHTTIASDAIEGRKTSAQLKGYLDTYK